MRKIRRTNDPSHDGSTSGVQTPTSPRRTFLAPKDPFPAPIALHTRAKCRYRRTGVGSGLKVSRSESRGEDDVVFIRPSYDEEVVGHLSAEGDSDPFVSG